MPLVCMACTGICGMTAQHGILRKCVGYLRKEGPRNRTLCRMRLRILCCNFSFVYDKSIINWKENNRKIVTNWRTRCKTRSFQGKRDYWHLLFAQSSCIPSYEETEHNFGGTWKFVIFHNIQQPRKTVTFEFIVARGQLERRNGHVTAMQ